MHSIYKFKSIKYRILSMLDGASILIGSFCSVCHAKDFVFAKKYIFIIFVIDFKDPKGINTVFDYNDVGKVVQERSVDNTIRTYDYDRAGRLISKVDKDRTKIAYDYDVNDNLIKKYYLSLSRELLDNTKNI